MIRAGKLRHRVKLQRPTVTIATDGTGAAGEGFATVREAWASIESLAGREGLTDRKVVAESSHEIRMREQPDLDETWQIVFKASVYRIVEVRRPAMRQIETIVYVAETKDRDQAVEAARA